MTESGKHSNKLDGSTQFNQKPQNPTESNSHQLQGWRTQGFCVFSLWLSLSNWFHLAPVSFLFAFFSDEKGTRCHVHSWKQKWNYSHFFYALLSLGLKSILIARPSLCVWMDMAFWKQRKSTCQNGGDQDLKSSLNTRDMMHALGLTRTHPWKHTMNSRRQAQPTKTTLWG